MTAEPSGARVRVLRIIARLNVGGPSIQAITLSQRLTALGYDTTLLRGREGPREGSMDGLAAELGVNPRLVPSLRRQIGFRDLFALVELTKCVREVQPHIVHTHAAKGGTLGRLACLLAGRPGKAVRIHTFHGHVLSEYFSPLLTRMFRGIERLLAKHSWKLIAVSAEVRDDLIRLGVATENKVVVIPLGFDLKRFDLRDDDRNHAREVTRDRWGVPSDAPAVVLVARLVPIKRVDRFLRIAAYLAAESNAFFVIVGDGELYAELRQLVATSVAARLKWAGMEADMPAVMAAADIVVLTSDNEGTPVSLIEAQASQRPVVSTRVGGVPSVVLDGDTGYLVDPHDEVAFAERIRTLLVNERLRQAFGQRGREHVFARFDLTRLTEDIDALYRQGLREVGHVAAR